ncbi:HAMP domain-containing protein [Ornithinibacillus sp. L9]|uniref:HAMP domain-containing protein n=1 Tax=Ornithinibacillus caprae TaxID=2678566 RepID=A0A6N8FH98_9BACI|nr:methyl-accepting chemotaxis protein [Ornithinibacillus caprae]MUK89042.1 HAMP domain-containing protein [Ornithinibacillus caprae]
MKSKFQFKSIRTKLLVGFSLIIALALVMAVYNNITTNLTINNTKDVAEKELPLLIADEKLAYNMAERTALIQGFLLFDDPSYRTKFDDTLEESFALEDTVLELSSSEKVQELIDKKIQWGTYTDQVFEAYDRGDKERAMDIMANDIEPLAEELMKEFKELAETRETAIDHEISEIISTGNLALWIGIALSIAIIVIGILITIITSQMITKPTKLLMERMKLIAEGNLNNTPLETKSKDEIGQLMVATNEMNESMRDLLTQISSVSEVVNTQSEELTQSANEVKAGSEQIATTMQELASGSETQANSASDLSSTMSSFTNLVQEANEKGELIEKASSDVLGMANEGTQLMEQSTNQMNKIDEIVKDAIQKVQGLDKQSQEISNLVTVIKDVAEQTNLLALNAAIEAARAGEHGKGFAVVADEVRKLAEQVSSSVTDITTIVTGIQQESNMVSDSLQGSYIEVENGKKSLVTTSETFNGINMYVSEMANSIKDVSENLTTIASNSQEMSTSIEEIAAISEESAAGVEQTSASTQQTTSTMEEVAGSSEQLAKLAEELNGLVRRFKL